MIILGLTGSIGMGKSTSAKILRDIGVPVHESDAAVHILMEEGGVAVGLIKKKFPELGDGPIDRQKLGAIIFSDHEKREKLEHILHPLVRESQDEFIKAQKKKGTDIVALDIPLLFETGAEERVDKVIVVTAPENVQRERVLSRTGMTEDKFNAILAHQMPDTQKCRRANFIVKTDISLDATERQLRDIIAELREQI